MAWYDIFKRTPRAESAERLEPTVGTRNPHANRSGRNPGLSVAQFREMAAFFGGETDRLLSGWQSNTHAIDYYLRSALTALRARSREAVRRGGHGKRFVSMIKSNVVGPHGVKVQAQTMRRAPGGGMMLDEPANDAVEQAFADWGAYHADYCGRMSWVDMQNMAIACAAQDGEFLFEVYEGAQYGKWGFQLRAIDPELLDVTKNTESNKSGNKIRLGVEYDKNGRRVRYHFRERDLTGDYSGGYASGRTYSISADSIIHGYIDEWPDQSRGIPWMHAGLTDLKHLDKYREAAIVNARGSAGMMIALTSEDSAEYEGEEDAEGDDGLTYDTYEPGSIKDFGDRKINTIDPAYPHQMYREFVKSHLQTIAAALGISYHTLANDLEGVNYSSARAGTLEDREVYKGLQQWFIRQLIMPVYQRWVLIALTTGLIRINGRPPMKSPNEYMAAQFQARRWQWVDPQKDGTANQLAIQNRTKSVSAIIREQGDNPDEVFKEIARERETMQRLGISPEDVSQTVAALNEPESEETDE